MSPDKVKIKEKVLSSYQLKTVDRYDSPVDNVKKLVSDFFDKENDALYYENLQLDARIKAKTSTSCIRNG